MCVPSNEQRLEETQVTGIPCPSNHLEPWCKIWPTNHIPAFAGSLQVTGYSTVRFRNLQDLLVRIPFACAVIALPSCQCHVLSLVPSLCTCTALILWRRQQRIKAVQVQREGTKERTWHWQLNKAMTAHANVMRTSRSWRLRNRTVEQPVTWRLPANAGMRFVGQILHHG